MSFIEIPHRIEICEGAAEPVAMELTPGQVIGPLDVGAQGQWRVTAVGVTPRHAFLFFDGEQLFLQSADVAKPVLANGKPLPKEWVAIAPPCEIKFGRAVLLFDAFDADDSISQRSTSGQQSLGAPADWGEDVDDEDSMPEDLGDKTHVIDIDVVVDEESEIDDEDSMPDHIGDKTNVFPVEEFMARTSATRRAALAQLLKLPQLPTSDAGMPPPSGPGMAPPSGPGMAPPSGPGMPAPSGPGMPLGTPIEEPTAATRTGLAGYSQPGPSQPGYSQPGYSQPGIHEEPSSTADLPGDPAAFENAPTASPDFGHSDPPSQKPPPLELEEIQVLPGTDPAGETSRTAAQKAGRWGSMSFPQKATAVLFLPMVLSVIVIFTDKPRPKPKPRTQTTTQASATTSAAETAPSGETAAPETSPETAPAGETNAELAQADSSADAAQPDTPDGDDDDSMAVKEPPKEAKGEKTMQRKAVDALASGSYEKAAVLYEELSDAYPTNKAYAAAAVITRQKAGTKK